MHSMQWLHHVAQKSTTYTFPLSNPVTGVPLTNFMTLIGGAGSPTQRTPAPDLSEAVEQAITARAQNRVRIDMDLLRWVCLALPGFRMRPRFAVRPMQEAVGFVIADDSLVY